MRPEAVREGVPLARYTTMQVGGPAQYLAEAASGAVVMRLVEWAAEEGVPWMILGQGSNVLFPDGGYNGLVVVYRSSGLERRWRERPTSGGAVMVEAEASAPLASLARWACRRGLSGLEWAAGLPGTVGGAVAGNAGAFGGAMEDVVSSAVVGWAGQPAQRTLPAELGLAYRRCLLLEERGPAAVLSVELQLQADDPGRCLARLDETERGRRLTQPAGASSGCVFRNPPQRAAGYLLDQCGLKGASVGGAVISERHANFILNRGGATATDVLTLMRLARRAVWEQFGILLEPEVRLMGDATLEAA